MKVGLKFSAPQARRDLPIAIVRKMNQAELPALLRKLGALGVEHAKDLTRERLTNDRPSDRRHPDHRDEAHYIDCFIGDPPGLSGGRARIIIRNTHHAARLLEKGNPAHDIHPRGLRARFPLDTLAGGNYASNSPPHFVYGLTGGKPFVEHPGSDGYNIMRDSAEYARKSFKPRLKVRVGVKR